MIIHKPHLCTVLEIWAPKYNSASGDWEVWLSVRKVSFSSPVILIKFTKAKHLIGQRFCITRREVERSEVTTNGRIPVYKVPFKKLEGWDSAQEIADIATSLFE